MTRFAGQMLMLAPSSIGLVKTADLPKRWQLDQRQDAWRKSAGIPTPASIPLRLQPAPGTRSMSATCSPACLVRRSSSGGTATGPGTMGPSPLLAPLASPYVGGEAACDEGISKC
jgi:hypothetical protein